MKRETHTQLIKKATKLLLQMGFNERELKFKVYYRRYYIDIIAEKEQKIYGTESIWWRVAAACGRVSQEKVEYLSRHFDQLVILRYLSKPEHIKMSEETIHELQELSLDGKRTLDETVLFLIRGRFGWLRCELTPNYIDPSKCYLCRLRCNKKSLYTRYSHNRGTVRAQNVFKRLE